MIEIGAQQEARDTARLAASRRFEAIRGESEALASRLTPEDQSIQSMPDVSPTKWHLAHTTWFFETFILTRFDPAYRVFDEAGMAGSMPWPETSPRTAATRVGEMRKTS